MNHNHDDSDSLADEFEQYRDDEMPDHNPVAFRRTRTGKTERIGTVLAKAVFYESIRQGDPGGFVAVDDVESGEFSALKRGGEENGG